MRHLVWMRRLILALVVLLTPWTTPSAQAQGPNPRIDTVDIPTVLDYAGQPFDVEVRATNVGSDAERGDSITISLPEGHDISILDASVPILPEDWSDCSYTPPHAWVVKPDSPCNRALEHNTGCQGQIDVRYPLAETWHKPWRSGEQHYIRVRVFPRNHASHVTVYVRVAIRASTEGCDLRLEPNERDVAATDQQGFPVRRLVVAVRTPTPPPPPTRTATRTYTPVPRPTDTLISTVPPVPPSSVTLTPTATSPSGGPGASVTPIPGTGGTTTSTPTPIGSSPISPSRLPQAVAISAICLLIIGAGGGGLWYFMRQRPGLQPAGSGGSSMPSGGTSTVSSTTQLVCPKCGANHRLGAQFCSNCGSAVGLIGDRYRVVSQLGRGGMGAVYLVEDERIRGKQWAVKAMSDAAIANPSERQQAISAFRREAQLLATLDHANLPRVVDFLSEGGQHYLVMDFITGNTLSELLSQRASPFPEAQVLGWAGQLCNVLSYLHSQNPPVVFRDLKPDNIMLTPAGQIRLIDFGIVRFFKPGQTTDTTRFGTPGYAPPEQYGQGQTDARSDIYALAVTLHHLLTRHDPSLTPMVLPNARQLNPAVTVSTAQAIERATRRDPAHRFQTVTEMRQALGI